MKIKIESKQIKKLASLARKEIRAAQEQAYFFWKRETPYRTGNARRKTTLNKNRETITANYPYAERLDEGYSSQSPKGMSQPTAKFYEREISRRFRKLGGR